jgi:hypothetical protein
MLLTWRRLNHANLGELVDHICMKRVASILLVAMVLLAACGEQSKDPDDVRQWLLDRLPEPAYRSDVERLLTKEGIPHSFFEARYESLLNDEGVPAGTPVVRALMPGARGGFLGADQDFQVYFVLEPNGRVSRIIVKEVFTFI